MKKLFCLLLVFWLPLFSGMANALSLQMELQRALPEQQIVKTLHACHQEVDATQHHVPSKPHSCFACGICAFVHAGVNVQAPAPIALGKPVVSTPNSLAISFYSQDYPPADKPPRHI